MRSDLAKVLHRAGGRPLLEHVIRACQPVKAAQILAVVGHQAEEVGALAESLGVDTVKQQPQRGTGHALQVARRALRKSAKLVIVVPGDAPLLRAETLTALLDTHRRGEAAATILSAELNDPTDYGRVVRDSEGRVQAVVEEKAATPEQRAIREVNSSIYCFTLEKLWPCLAALRPNNAHRELYLTDAIALLRQRNERVLAQVAPDANEILGCNTRINLADVDRIFRARKAAELMEAGVTIYLPETVVIDPEVSAGEDTVIESCVQLLGKTRIGARCTIQTGSVLRDTRLDDEVIIGAHSTLDSSRVGNKAHVGPFARLRPGADIRAGAHIGNFVEVKNSVVHEGAKAGHLTYLGDASVGREANIGAGRSLATMTAWRSTRRRSAIAFLSGVIARWWLRCGLATARTWRLGPRSRKMSRRMRWEWRGDGRRTSLGGRQRDGASWLGLGVTRAARNRSAEVKWRVERK